MYLYDKMVYDYELRIKTNGGATNDKSPVERTTYVDLGLLISKLSMVVMIFLEHEILILNLTF